MTESEQFFRYTAPDGKVKGDVNENDSVISILETTATDELANSSVCSKMEHTAKDGVANSAKDYYPEPIQYGYPPDLQDAAVQTVLQQAEALSSTWTMPSHFGAEQ